MACDKIVYFDVRSGNLSFRYYPDTDEVFRGFSKYPYVDLKRIVDLIEKIKREK